MINKVYFRTDQDTSDYDGHSQNWHGENSFSLGEVVYGEKITMIGYGYMHEDVPCIKIFVGAGKLYCEIPMTSVCRVYYSIKD